MLITGPWQAEVLPPDARENERPWIKDANGKWVALSCGDTKAESITNAQAIAALPELVEVLLPFAAMADVADEYGHGPGSTCEWRMSYDDFARARALLARLEGL